MNKLQKAVLSLKSNVRMKISAIVIFALIAGYLLGNIGEEKSHNHSAEVNSDKAEANTAKIWTCSMHPQIKLPKSGKCPVCFMDLIPLQSDNNNNNNNADKAGGGRLLVLSDAAKRLASIVSVPAVRGKSSSELKLLGKIAVDESRIETISMRTGGRIDKLFVDFTGKNVRKGDQLALVYSPELISVQQELISAFQAYSNLSSNAAELVKNNALGLLNASKDKLRLLGFSESDLKQIITLGTPSDHMIIRSSQSGVVLEKMAVVGNYVEPGMPLFKIADLSRIWINLDAYENDIQWMKTGQMVNFTVEAFPGENFIGRVSFIDPVVDPVSRTVKVRVESSNSEGRLKPDMFVKATLKYGASEKNSMSVKKSEEPVMIPASAPLLTGERAIVYVEVSSDSAGTIYEGREVILGSQVGDSYIVKSGIEEGEKVVINGAFRIDSELQIRAKPSMMNPQDGITSTGQHGHEDNHPAAEKESSENKQQMDQEDKRTVIMQNNSSSEISGSFKSDLEKIYNNHLIVTKFLAEDKFEEARKNMADQAKLIHILRNANIQNSTLTSTIDKIINSLKHVNHTQDISGLRQIFENVSMQIINLEKQYGHTGEERYIVFCPMAFNNRGAYWIQNEKQITNPYFGSSMLRCGKIKETISSEGSPIKGK